MSVAITLRGLLVFRNLTSVQDFRVLMVLFGHIGERNQLDVSQVVVARALGISRQSVWSSYKSLQEKEILRRERRNGVDVYHVNDDLVRKVVRMVELPEPERLEEEIGFGESFALAEKYAEEERRMKAANIRGVMDGGKAKAKKPPEKKSGKT